MKSLRAASTATILSSLIIVLMLVVALSTATFAWFSANNVVNVSSISFVADTREGEKQGDLQIAWTPTMAENNHVINFAQPEQHNMRLKPMMPLAAPVIGATLDKDEDGEDLFALGFTMGVQEAGTYMYNGFVYADDNAIRPYLCLGALAQQDAFYLINKNPSFAQRVSVDYVIEGELRDKLCVAIFVENKLHWVLSNNKEIYYGVIERNSRVADTKHVETPVTISYNKTVVVPANSSVRLTMYAWYNGVIMYDSDVDKTSVLSILKFNGAYMSTAG